MTLQMHAVIAASERLGDVDSLAEPHDVLGAAPALAADIIPRLCAMRRTIGAAEFAVLACPAAGSRIRSQLAPVLVDTDLEGAADDRALVRGALGQALATHLERSALPIAWAGSDGDGPMVDADCQRLIVQANFPDATAAGVAFPVRLGNLGNGFVVFLGEGLKLKAGSLFELHRLSYRIMTDLLEIEIRKTAPRQSLSERELACLQWAGDGCKSEAIAEKLGLSVHTVNAYLGSATAKLDAVNRIQAIAKAIRLGFIV